jgi:uncharacterized membrane protein
LPNNKSQLSELPFIAPCRSLSASAPLSWLKQGIADTKRAPLASLSYGALMASMLMFMTFVAWQLGSAWIMLMLLCALVFIVPLTCIGTYAISAQIERGLKVSLERTLNASFRRYLGTELVYALVILVVFLVWARASSMASIFLPSTGTYEVAEMTGYLSILALVALIFLSVTFAASVFSLPMIMHRDVDAITAIVTSINAVMRNKVTMLVWGLLIALALIIGILTAGLALIFLLPSIGHASWHAYLETIDADQFPRHSLGITSIKRPPNNS